MPALLENRGYQRARTLDEARRIRARGVAEEGVRDVGGSEIGGVKVGAARAHTKTEALLCVVREESKK